MLYEKYFLTYRNLSYVYYSVDNFVEQSWHIYMVGILRIVGLLSSSQSIVSSDIYVVLKVLKFKGWYKESIPEMPFEKYRIRYVDILYFLEDNSMIIIEPKVENSGLSQGINLFVVIAAEVSRSVPDIAVCTL